jgi:hypothetical protein
MMLSEALAMEHYRLHIIEQWPDGANRDAALAGVRSALDGLAASQSGGLAAWVCIVCGSGGKQPARDGGCSRPGRQV